MSRWNNKVVLVTGGSAGLGQAIAQEFAEAGASVMIAARDAQRLAQAAEQMSSGGLRVQGIAADVTKNDDARRLIEQTTAAFGRLDVLVNCVGRSTRGAVSDMSADEFAALLDVNFLSAVRCTTAALPHLRQARGHVVLIGSLAAKAASPFMGAYPASKFPLAALAQQLRMELAPDGVHTLLVCPGPIRRDDAGTRYDAASANLPDSARRPGGGVKLAGIDPHLLARRIRRFCELRKAELIVPGRARLLFAIGQLWPNLGDWIIRRMTR
jgi:NAD(P)-dependent dehydrogenase (short-subunit alcohol dehydrogenase family)